MRSVSSTLRAATALFFIASSSIVAAQDTGVYSLSNGGLWLPGSTQIVAFSVSSPVQNTLHVQQMTFSDGTSPPVAFCQDAFANAQQVVSCTFVVPPNATLSSSVNTAAIRVDWNDCRKLGFLVNCATNSGGTSQKTLSITRTADTNSTAGTPDISNSTNAQEAQGETASSGMSLITICILAGSIIATLALITAVAYCIRRHRRNKEMACLLDDRMLINDKLSAAGNFGKVGHGVHGYYRGHNSANRQFFGSASISPIQAAAIRSAAAAAASTTIVSPIMASGPRSGSPVSPTTPGFHRTSPLSPSYYGPQPIIHYGQPSIQRQHHNLPPQFSYGAPMTLQSPVYMRMPPNDPSSHHTPMPIHQYMPKHDNSGDSL